MKIKSPYARTRVQTHIPKDAQTKAVQSEKHACDINNIVARAMKSGQLPVLVNRQPLPELPEASSYQEMLNKVVFAQQAFERLPSAVRAEFGNQPQNMLYALSEAKNNRELAKKMQTLGLMDAPLPLTSEPSQSAPQNASDEKAPSAEGGK